MDTKLLDVPFAHREGTFLTELESRVLRRIGKQVNNFRLVVQDQGLILTGSTLSYYAKQLAQQAVMEATEIPIVRNEIEVA